MNGVELIAEERVRQVEEEGWTPQHDREHTSGQLARAAGCYALYAGGLRTLPGSGPLGTGWPWPWDKSGFKPDDEDVIRTLAKAGALIAAEIDRLQERYGRKIQGEQL